MLKAVFDTNVYISALIAQGSKAERAYLHAVEGRIAFYTSVPILTEMAEKLRTKFLWEDDKIIGAVKHISAIAAVLRPGFRISILKDDPDNRVLECARQGRTDLIVTGDKHLLSLGRFESTRIVKLGEFLESIK